MATVTFEKISKSFPGVQALDGVSFEVRSGECHALIGENGAGKSTLGKILAGVYVADGGMLKIDGREVQPTTPLAARQMGVAMVHQELAFCPNLTIAENLCLGNLPHKAGWLDRRQMKAIARTMLEKIESDMDVDQAIGSLTTGQEQIVQIAGAVGTEARVIIMDEPTSSLSAHESEHLFHLLDRLKKRGITVLYVSHRMEEIFRLCDSITVLRDGHHVSTCPVSETDTNRVVHEMIGREVTTYSPTHVNQPLGKEVMTVTDLSSPGKFHDISLTLCEGEILGLAGLVGAGRSELAQAIFGLDPRATGTITIEGRELTTGSIHDAMNSGLGMLPEDRKRQGLVLSMNCRENTSLADLKRFTQLGMVRRRQETDVSLQFANRLRLKTPSLESAMAGLSGGNQQKVALAKWLARHCKVLIVDEPTRGIDVGAKEEIHKLLDELAEQGLSILLISSELPEVLSLSRRLMVMRDGGLAGYLERTDINETNAMRLMAGL